MIIYFVFKGDGYYPMGGWDDFVEAFTVLDSAIASAKDLDWGQWSHIVRFNLIRFSGEVIKRYDLHSEPGGSKIREVAVDYSKIIEEWDKK